MKENIERIRQNFNEFAARKKLRSTCQRDIIMTEFWKIEHHMTAEELHTVVHKKDQRISLATVYRTLKLMCESGLADEIKRDRGKALYEHKLDHPHHDHLICVKCGKIIEISNPELENLQDRIAKEKRFLPQKHRLDIFGLCSSCR